MKTKYLKINSADNVAVAISDLKAGEEITVDNQTIRLAEDVPAGHKVALKDFVEGENVIKYGYPIGHARKALGKGCWINEKNIHTNLAGLLEYTYNRRRGHPQRDMDCPHSGMRERHRQPVGRKAP